MDPIMKSTIYWTMSTINHFNYWTPNFSYLSPGPFSNHTMNNSSRLTAHGPSHPQIGTSALDEKNNLKRLLQFKISFLIAYYFDVGIFLLVDYSLKPWFRLYDCILGILGDDQWFFFFFGHWDWADILIKLKKVENSESVSFFFICNHFVFFSLFVITLCLLKIL